MEPSKLTELPALWSPPAGHSPRRSPRPPSQAAGGLLGAWFTRHLGEARAKQLQHQLEHGGLLLWVHIRDAAHETRAIEILKTHGADDVHGHDLPATADPADNPLAGLEIDPNLPGARL